MHVQQSAIHHVFIGEQHLCCLAVRQRHFCYQHTAMLGVHLRQHKPRAVRDFRKREIALCVALSPPDHAFQTGIGCLRRFRFASSDDHVPKHLAKVRCRWQQQNSVPCTCDDASSLLREKGLSAYAVFAWFRVWFMFRVIELGPHFHKWWRRLSPRRSSGASRVCERQAEQHCKQPHYFCLMTRHRVPIAIAPGVSWLPPRGNRNRREAPSGNKSCSRSSVQPLAWV